MDSKERKQLKGFIAVIKTENDSIGKRLTSIISILGSMRASQLGVDLMISQIKEKLEK